MKWCSWTSIVEKETAKAQASPITSADFPYRDPMTQAIVKELKAEAIQAIIKAYEICNDGA